MSKVSVMEIKICGITNQEDAVNACTYGVDALGFIFCEKSPRYVTPEAARQIIEDLPGGITTVGVFVNQDVQAVIDIYKFCLLDLIQLHGDETPAYCRQLPEAVLIKAVTPRGEEDLNVIKEYAVKAVLIDARAPGLYGGTGQTSDWKLAVKLKEMHRLILSGGLNAKNIMEAINTVSPDAVDVNSGVEISPGKKDREKMKRIIELVHTVRMKSRGKIFTD